MKRISSMLLVVMLLASQMCVFAETSYTNLIDAVKADESVDMSLINEDEIIYAEITSYINLDKDIKPTSFYLYMPSLDGKDYYTAGFDKNEYVATTKNFVATEPLKYYSVDEAKEFATNNGLSEPTEIKAILTHGRIGLFAYSIVCDGKDYIIPYYFTTDSTYNITNDNTVRLSLGTAYTIDEFVTISEKEHTLYDEYMNAEREKDNRPTVSLDENGDEVIKVNGTNLDDVLSDLTDSIEQMAFSSTIKMGVKNSDENYIVTYRWQKGCDVNDVSKFAEGLFEEITTQVTGGTPSLSKNVSYCNFGLKHDEGYQSVRYQLEISVYNDGVKIIVNRNNEIVLNVKNSDAITNYINKYSNGDFDGFAYEKNDENKPYIRGNIDGLTKTDVIEFEFKLPTDTDNDISREVATPGKTVKGIFERYRENKYRSTYILTLSGNKGTISFCMETQSSLSGEEEIFSNNIPVAFLNTIRYENGNIVEYKVGKDGIFYEFKMVFKSGDISEAYFEDVKCTDLKYTQLTEDTKLSDEFVEKDKEAVIREAKECADTLYEFGLFKGTDKGYELEKSLTREESATILVRLLGEEEKVDADDFDEVFVDVDKDRWSYAYVMYCYKHNITKGTGANTFSPDVQIDANQFITLMMRLLGYTEVNPDTALEKSVEYKLLPEEKIDELTTKKVFTRSDMVQIVYNSLKTQMDDETVFADYLLEKGILTEKEIEQIK